MPAGLRGFIPASIRRHNGQLQVEWKRSFDTLPSLPMYDWALRAVDARCTRLDILEEYAQDFDDEKLRAIIFHVARCGSTALANAFRSVGRTLVISESTALSQIVRTDNASLLALSVPQRATLARGFLAAVLKEYPAAFIALKMPSIVSWSVQSALDVLPAAPWCFLSRRPTDVIASLDRNGSQLLSNPQRARTLLYKLTGIPAARDLAPRLIVAHLLTRYLQTASSAASDGAIFLDYEHFTVDRVSTIVHSLLGVRPDQATRDAIATSLSVYSKSPVPRLFVPPPMSEPGVTGIDALDDAYEAYRVVAARYSIDRVRPQLATA